MTIDNLTIGDIKNREIKSMAYNIAHMFASDNPSFDCSRFYTACGIE